MTFYIRLWPFGVVLQQEGESLQDAIDALGVTLDDVEEWWTEGQKEQGRAS